MTQLMVTYSNPVEILAVAGLLCCAPNLRAHWTADGDAVITGASDDEVIALAARVIGEQPVPGWMPDNRGSWRNLTLGWRRHALRQCAAWIGRGGAVTPWHMVSGQQTVPGTLRELYTYVMDSGAATAAHQALYAPRRVVGLHSLGWDSAAGRMTSVKGSSGRDALPSCVPGQVLLAQRALSAYRVRHSYAIHGWRRCWSGDSWAWCALLPAPATPVDWRQWAQLVAGSVPIDAYRGWIMRSIRLPVPGGMGRHHMQPCMPAPIGLRWPAPDAGGSYADLHRTERRLLRALARLEAA